MAIVEYTLDESVAIITLNSGENRFNPDFLDAYLGVMDEIEKDTEAQAIVVRSAHEKIFSNGIDLEWLIPVVQNQNMEEAKDFFFKLNRVFKRTLTSPLITIAAITGHAFAGGAIWSCAFDFRFMRSDRGFFCFPEVDLGIPFLPGMNMLLKKAIPMYKVEELQLSGNRITADECEKCHMIVKACHMDDIMNESVAFAKKFRKKRAVLLEMKARLYKDIVHALDVEDVPYIESEKFHIG